MHSSPLSCAQPTQANTIAAHQAAHIQCVKTTLSLASSHFSPTFPTLFAGSRPTRRRADNAGINTLRAIPWQFAWTQTRLILPSWLGVGAALGGAVKAGNLPALRAMYREWPFFAATIDLIEMILAKVGVFDCV